MIYSMQFPLLLMELFSLSGSLTSSILGGPDCCGWCWGCFTLWRACYSCSIRSAGCKVQNPILICPLLNTKCRTYTWYANVMSTMWLFGHTSNVRILLYFIPFGFLDLVCIKNLSEVHLAGYEFFFSNHSFSIFWVCALLFRTPDPQGKLPEETLDASGLKKCFLKKGFSWVLHFLDRFNWQFTWKRPLWSHFASKGPFLYLNKYIFESFCYNNINASILIKLELSKIFVSWNIYICQSFTRSGY